MGVSEIIAIIMAVSPGFLGAMIFIFYRKIPKIVENKFAICLKCEVIELSGDWDKSNESICIKCNNKMEIMEMPEDFYLLQVSYLRKTILILSPLVFVPIIALLDILITGTIGSLTYIIMAALAFTFFGVLIVYSFLSERRYKEDLLNWVKSAR